MYQSNPGEYFDSKNDPSAYKNYTRIERYYYELYKGNMTQAEVDEKINAMRKNDYRKEAQDILTHTPLRRIITCHFLAGVKILIYFSLCVIRITGNI